MAVLASSSVMPWTRSRNEIRSSTVNDSDTGILGVGMLLRRKTTIDATSTIKRDNNAPVNGTVEERPMKSKSKSFEERKLSSMTG